MAEMTFTAKAAADTTQIEVILVTAGRLLYKEDGSLDTATERCEYEFTTPENATLTVEAAQVAAEGISLDKDTLTVVRGKSEELKATDFLNLYGFSPTYEGTATNAFYLRRINNSDIGAYSFIPPKLQEMLERDGATFTGRPNRDSLGEFDYTRGSGWMYAIDGDVYPGRSMSLYPVQPGMVIYLRFTLAYGKDIGGFVDDGASYGSLSSYCRMWVNNNFNGLELAHDFQETDRLEPTATEDGYICLFLLVIILCWWKLLEVAK